MPNAKKVAQAEIYSDLLSNRTNFVVVEFEKTPHKAMETLRKTLKKSDARFKVVKSTLLEKSMQNMSSEKNDLTVFLEKAFPIKGPSAILALGENWTEGLKAFYDYVKKDESLRFKVGYVEKNVYDKKQVEGLAQLPSKPELMAKLIGSMKAPMMKTVFSMKYNMTRFVTVLSEKAKQG
jgi:large subunit ribosomal protein L10